MYRREKQLKELADKGYFIMSDGTKSTDHEVPAKKKKTKRAVSKTEEKVSKKRKSSKTMEKKDKKGGDKKKDKKVKEDKKAKGGKKAADEDDLDVESGGE